ncbi:MAG: methyl-accepting chemotaxis protein [Candidatus Omnitrophica bacterium]|nr:methyl-accepting chemotaxis protein [Candidatus Omnitrophota bacterium]
MDKRTYRRKNYLIDKKFQAKFIVKFSALIFLGGLLTVVLLYFLGTQSKTVAIQNSRVIAKTTADFILPLLIQTVIAVTVLVGIIAGILTLFISHKISGPLYRLKKVIERLERGDFSSEFNIRSTDQLSGLADEINSMIRNTKQEVCGIKNKAISLKQKLDSLTENDFPASKRGALTELKKIAEELDKAVRYFKV